MSNLDYIIEQEEITIKTYIRQHLGISAKALTKLKSSGIFLNGVHAIVTQEMKKGDVLTLVAKDEPKKVYVAENLPIEIIYEDDNLLIINKKAFETVYPAGEHMTGSVLNAVAFHRPEITFRPIYRLDRNTSGLLVIAKNKIASSCEIEKEYLAVCHGVTNDSGTIDSLIGLEDGSRIKRTTGHGQTARTDYVKIMSDENFSLVKVKIHTGRTHQIRVHMSSIGHPLVGDDLYGGDTERINRQALHCHKIKITNKALGLDEVFVSPVPEDIYNSYKNLF